MSTSSDFSACKSLHSCARRTGVFLANLAIEEFARGTTHTLMANLGTRLFTLASFLAEPAVPISRELEDHATQVLRTLRNVFIVPTVQPRRATDISSEIEARLDDGDPDGAAKRVIIYFQEYPDEAEALSQLCDSLRFQVSASTKSWHTTTSLPKTFTVPVPNRYESSVNEVLYNSVKLHMKCDHTDDRGCERRMSEPYPAAWLPTRLRLSGPFQSKHWAVFDVVTSSLKQGFWTQFRWAISKQTTREESDVRPPQDRFDIKYEEITKQDEYDKPIDDLNMKKLRDPGYICHILNPEETSLCIELKLIFETRLVEWRSPGSIEPLFPHNGVNLLNVLQSCHPLTVKDKITLSHTVAQAFWQLYASDMMQSVWTNETIWFMHEHKRDENQDTLDEMADKLPIWPYINFNFECDKNEFIETPQWPDQRPLPHRFPHILALAALLLDIGLGRPVGTKIYRTLQNRDHVIRALSSVTSGLKQLEVMRWDGFTLHKPYFIQAIRFCANYSGQESNSELESPSTVQEHTGSTNTSDTSLTITKRKEVLYDNVIRPLAWLAGAFHEDNKNDLYTPYLRGHRIAASGSTTIAATPGSQGSTVVAAAPSPGGLSNDDNPWYQKFWDFAMSTQELIGVTTYEPQQAPPTEPQQVPPTEPQQAPPTKPQQAPPTFKVAVLDTGYNPEMACFKKRRRQAKDQTLGQISWIDCVDDYPSYQPIDEDGHGSYMAQLVMNAAPLADILVIRVSRRAEEILQAKKNIEDAIIRAGIQEMVDIISMSFGFEGDDDSVRNIHNAITTVDMKRNGRVIFLAAASNNSSHQTDMFPARHRCVIPMHATNHKGDFVFNPSTSECILGTFSEGPAVTLQEHMDAYPSLRLNRPTSSAATAVGAGITALILAHISALVWAHNHGGLNLGTDFHNSTAVIIDQLKTGSKMQGVLKQMATASGGNSKRLFVNPITFWRNAFRNTNDDRQMHVNILMEIDHFLRHCSG